MYCFVFAAETFALNAVHADGQQGNKKKTNFTNEKLYLRIPTGVDAINFTMHNGEYNAVLLTKMQLIGLSAYAFSRMGHTIYTENIQVNK